MSKNVEETCLSGTKENNEYCQCSVCFDRDSNQGPPECANHFPERLVLAYWLGASTGSADDRLLKPL
jgi:hypothetical protein